MMSTIPIGSVSIPAHNEAATIRRCLSALLDGFSPGELDVVVACNGCTDGTADIVRSSWPSVRVVEVGLASKPAALRAADEVLSTFPRIYLDADVVLPAASARELIEYLRTAGALAARPPMRHDTSGADFLVRGYYRTWSRLFDRESSLWAPGGIYAVSATGRARYGAYPDIIADDLFAAKSFAKSEVRIVGSAPAVVTVPRGIRDLIRVLRRRYQGNVDISRLPDRPEKSGLSTFLKSIVLMISRPEMAADSVIFMTIAATVRVTRMISPPKGWSRDDSSRMPEVVDGSHFAKEAAS